MIGCLHTGGYWLVVALRLSFLPIASDGLLWTDISTRGLPSLLQNGSNPYVRHSIPTQEGRAYTPLDRSAAREDDWRLGTRRKNTRGSGGGTWVDCSVALRSSLGLWSHAILVIISAPPLL
ncbi:hypothetical protein GJ744_002564 [Endocarpon pusillum]|uniref:Secreted protein n=1 Tax=Endocarpon pusillum TaxID=364733 RepID=A0A8H7AAM8_9EURO|nr:hypothetical protein GJ744_002564 [Endocarpon pusillum]